MTSKRLAKLPIFCVFVLTALPYGRSTSQTPGHPAEAAMQSCLAAARTALGPRAEVLKCGHLTSPRALVSVAAITLKHFAENSDGIPVAKLMVLRNMAGSSQWVVKFTADKSGTKNNIGFIATDFIDDTTPITGYRVSFSAQRSDGTVGFTMYVYYLSPDGHNEGVPVEVSWNPAVKRFQEVDYGDGDVFRAETKNPPHIRTPKPR